MIRFLISAVLFTATVCAQLTGVYPPEYTYRPLGAWNAQINMTPGSPRMEMVIDNMPAGTFGSIAFRDHFQDVGVTRPSTSGTMPLVVDYSIGHAGTASLSFTANHVGTPTTLFSGNVNWPSSTSQFSAIGGINAFIAEPFNRVVTLGTALVNTTAGLSAVISLDITGAVSQTLQFIDYNLISNISTTTNYFDSMSLMTSNLCGQEASYSTVGTFNSSGLKYFYHNSYGLAYTVVLVGGYGASFTMPITSSYINCSIFVDPNNSVALLATSASTPGNVAIPTALWGTPLCAAQFDWDGSSNFFDSYNGSYLLQNPAHVWDVSTTGLPSTRLMIPILSNSSQWEFMSVRIY